jgi:hypothetical protein
VLSDHVSAIPRSKVSRPADGSGFFLFSTCIMAHQRVVLLLADPWLPVFPCMTDVGYSLPRWTPLFIPLEEVSVVVLSVFCCTFSCVGEVG